MLSKDQNFTQVMIERWIKINAQKVEGKERLDVGEAR
jgi:hypothetical protein